MTDITDIHRLAYKRVEEIRDMPSFANAWAELRKLLPSELTNPQPVLPEMPGYYSGDVETVWMLRHTGYWYKVGDLENRVELDEVQSFAPFTRLFPERPQINADQVVDILRKAITTQECAEQIVNLANGADRD